MYFLNTVNHRELLIVCQKGYATSKHNKTRIPFKALLNLLGEELYCLTYLNILFNNNIFTYLFMRLISINNQISIEHLTFHLNRIHYCAGAPFKRIHSAIGIFMHLGDLEAFLPFHTSHRRCARLMKDRANVRAIGEYSYWRLELQYNRCIMGSGLILLKYNIIQLLNIRYSKLLQELR